MPAKNMEPIHNMIDYGVIPHRVDRKHMGGIISVDFRKITGN